MNAESEKSSVVAEQRRAKSEIYGPAWPLPPTTFPASGVKREEMKKGRERWEERINAPWEGHERRIISPG